MKIKIIDTPLLQKLFLWILILIIPLIQYYGLIDTALLPKYLAINLLFTIFFIYLIIKNQEVHLKFNNAHIILALFIIYTGISVLYSPIKYDALFEWSKTFIFLIGIFILQTIFDKKLIILTASKAFSLLGITVSIWGIIQFIMHCNGGISHEELYAIKASFVHKNLFTEIIFLTIPFSLFNSKYYKGIWQIIGIISFLLCFSLVVILMTRAVWMATLVSFILTAGILLYHFKPQKSSILKSLYISIGIIVFTFAIVTAYSRFDSFTTFQKQSRKIFNLKYGSVQDRIQLWNKTFDIIKEKPFFGYGLSSWKIQILKEGNHCKISENELTFYQRPHNDYLWIFAENGIIGLLIYILFIILFYHYLFRELIKSKNSLRIIYPMLFLGFTGYLVFSFFSFPKERIDHLIFLIIIASIIINYDPWKTVKLKSFWLTPIVIILIGFSILSMYRINSERKMKKIYSEKNKNNWQAVIKEAESINLNFYPIDHYSTPITCYLGNAYFNLQQYDKAFEYYKIAYNINPYHIHVLNELSKCYSVYKDNDEALKLLNQALEITPEFLDALMNKCAVLYSEKRFLEAYEPFRKIPPSDNSEYELYAKKIIPAKFKSICDKLNSEEIAKILIDIGNTPEWMWHLYEKSYQNNITFEKQILIDSVYILYEVEKQISKKEAEKLRKRFNI